MGVLDRIGREIERSGHKLEKEIIRPYAREFERIPGIGKLTRQLHESRVAQREAKIEALALQEEKRRSVVEERLRLQGQQELAAGMRAKLRRRTMAENLVSGIEFTDTSNMTMVQDQTTNRIPALDPIDELGNTVPEVV